MSGLCKTAGLCSEKIHRLCSKHFVEDRPTEQHGYPELFSNNTTRNQKILDLSYIHPENG
jgi:hypothetical protein